MEIRYCFKRVSDLVIYFVLFSHVSSIVLFRKRAMLENLPYDLNLSILLDRESLFTVSSELVVQSILYSSVLHKSRKKCGSSGTDIWRFGHILTN